MNPHVRLSVGWSVGHLLDWSVWLKLYFRIENLSYHLLFYYFLINLLFLLLKGLIFEKLAPTKTCYS